MKKGFVLFWLLAGSLALSAQSKYPTLEKLVYDGYYNWGFIWIKAGKVVFSTTDSEKYPNANCLEAVGTSLPFWDSFFRLRDTLVSHHDKKTFFPYEFSQHQPHRQIPADGHGAFEAGNIRYVVRCLVGSGIGF